MDELRRKEIEGFSCEATVQSVLGPWGCGGAASRACIQTAVEDSPDYLWLKKFAEPLPGIELPKGQTQTSDTETRKALREYAYALRDYILRHQLTRKKPVTQLRSNHGNTVKLALYDRGTLVEQIKLTTSHLKKASNCDCSSGNNSEQVMTIFREKLSTIPTHEAIYTLSEVDYLLAYDYPQIQYLLQLREAYKSFPEIEATEKIPEFCKSIDKAEARTIKKWSECHTFGVNCGPNAKLSSPLFCQTARIEAYCRYIIERKREQLVHTFRYQVRAGAKGNLAKHTGESFCDEDAWYYEMCSGVSLVSELAALVYKLDQLNKQRVFLPSDEDESAKWMDCFRDSIYDALEYNAEKISACPAVYWRIAHLKRIIYEVNTICQNLDESRRLQRPVPYGCEAPLSMGPLPTTQRDWINMGIDIFNQMISAFPEPLTFWDKDSQQFSNISCDNDNSDSISGVMAANAKLRSSPRIGASKGARPYLAYCLSDAEPYVKKLKKAAADNSAKDMSFKLRHEGGVKNVFTEIHRRLYGGNTGFKYIETI